MRATGSLFVDDGETLVSAAVAGMGLVLLPEWLIGDEFATGRLVEFFDQYAFDLVVTPLYALFVPGPFTPPKVRMFVDFQTAKFGRSYAWSGRL